MSKRRLAAIDVGTNTALLLVAEVSPDGEIGPLAERETIVRLGEGVDRTKKLSEAAIARTLSVLEQYVELAQRLGSTGVVVSGTSAVRDAGNRDEFLERLRQHLGIQMLVLSGEQEARLTYFGALSNKRHLEDGLLMMDIGGGSTEFVLGTREEPRQMLSLDIGSVRLTERVIRHDPVTGEEVAAIRRLIRSALEDHFPAATREVAHFIGVAGTMTTLASMRLKLAEYDPERIDGLVLLREQVESLVTELIRKSLEERRQIAGLNPRRADVILAGALILLETMDFWGLRSVVVSHRGLRFGLLLREVGLIRD